MSKMKANPNPLLRRFHAFRRRNRANRNGVALIIVVGLLAVLLIASASFSVFMRIERAGAANFRHGATARQMLQAGLSRAIEDIHLNVEDKPYPDFDVLTSVDHESVLDPNRLAVTSRVLSVSAMEYVPGALQDAVHAARPHWKPVVAPPDAGEQQHLVGRYGYVIVNLSGLLDANIVGDADAERDVGGDPREIRLSHDLLSEFEDADDVDRFASERAQHLRYQNLPELKRLNTGLDRNQLRHFADFSRDPVPENFDELAYIGGDDIDAWDPAAILEALEAAGVPNHELVGGLRQHQIALLNMRDWVSPGLVPVGGYGVDRFAYPSIKPVPKLCQMLVVVDYQRTVSDSVDHPNTYRHRIRYGYFVNAAQPYRRPPPGNYAIRFKFEAGSVQGDASFQELFPLHNHDGVLESINDAYAPSGSHDALLFHREEDVAELYSTAEYPPRMLVAMWASAEVQHESEGVVDRVPATGFDNPVGHGVRLPIDINIDQAIQDRSDKEPGPHDDNRIRLFFWAETFDPRFNWHRDHWMLSRLLAGPPDAHEWPDPPAPNPTRFPTWMARQILGANAYADRDVWEQRYENYLPILNNLMGIMDAVPGVDGMEAAMLLPQRRFHVEAPGAGEPMPFESVGELGYLPIGPWTSIRLQNFRVEPSPNVEHNPGWHTPEFRDYRPPHRVLDHFTLLEEPRAVQGRVNVNSPVENIIASVYYDMPLREQLSDATRRLPLLAPTQGDPDEPPGNVRQIEQFFRDWRYPPNDPIRYIGNLSELGRIFEGVMGEGLNNRINARIQQEHQADVNQINDFDREAIIRNAAGLFSTRHQLFLVILRADAFAPAFGMTGIEQGSVLATGHAVALLWRDAAPDSTDPSANPVHPILIRHFQTLDP